MDTKSMISKSRRASDPHELLLNLTDKINLKRSDKYVALSNLSICYTWKKIKNIYKNNFKIQLRHGMKSLNQLMGDILYQIFKTILSISSKNHEAVTDNPNIMIYVNTIKNKITFKTKTGYYLELSTPETIKLLGSTKSKIANGKNSEIIPYLEITEVVLS